MRGGFADVSPTGLIVLAETALPEGELDAVRLDQEMHPDAEETSPTRPTSRSACGRRSSTACASSRTR